MLYAILLVIIISLIIFVVVIGKSESKKTKEIKSLDEKLNLATGNLHKIRLDAGPYLKNKDKLNELILELAKLSDDKTRLNIDLLETNSEYAELTSKIDLVNLGVSRREFTYNDSPDYQSALKEIWKKQDEMLKDKKAAVCRLEWEVAGSKKSGDQMVGNLIKLALRAFNGESDYAVAKVKWNNFESMKDKILKSETAIEKLLEKWGITISDSYRNLKISELKLSYEKVELDRRIIDEQRAIREEQREEERVIREIEQAKKKAEQEEEKIESALIKAKAEMATAHTVDLTKHMERIRELEQKLIIAEEVRKRAISQAQLTKSGNVYIISNPGSFGANIYKIGMTRRLDPMDRIWELSDASVPFDFDVHGMIKTDDAPKLEYKFHQAFAAKRVNLVNERKEYFNVTINEIQEL